MNENCLFCYAQLLNPLLWRISNESRAFNYQMRNLTIMKTDRICSFSNTDKKGNSICLTSKIHAIDEEHLLPQNKVKVNRGAVSATKFKRLISGKANRIEIWTPFDFMNQLGIST